ncbi:UNVERIFIED_ORG: putative RDD family membrane protein YckC [Actinomadura viridilutea]|nr:RDD family protein [Actinomadura rubrobrunea]
MTQPPHDPAPGERPSGERPQEEPWRAPGEPEAQPPPYPGAYGGQGPYGGVPEHGAPPDRGGDRRPPGAADLASRWARLGAGIVDSVLISLVMLPIWWTVVDWSRVADPAPNAPVADRDRLLANLAAIAIAFVYYWLMHLRFGQTLGKMLLRIRVVRADDGGAIDAGQAAGRSAFYTVLGGVCGCIGLLDIAWILWDERKQALHDKAARTVVVKAGPGTPNPYARR